MPEITNDENKLSVGTIGWASDGGNAYSLGNAENGGISLVNVTMFRGKDPTTKLVSGVGQGQRIMCQLGQSMISMPSYGARVLVAMPDPNPMTPGHSVVIETLGNTAWKNQGNTGPGDLVIPCSSGPARIIMTGSGGGAFVTTAADGSSIMASIDPTNGCHIAGPWGSISFDNYGLRGNIGGGPTFKFYNVGGLPPPFDILAGSIAQISAGTVKVDGLQVLLGPDSANSIFVPTAAYQDSDGLPAPAPLLNDILEALPVFLEALSTLAISLGANPVYTGVTPAQLSALEAAITQLTVGTNLATTILTTPCVKVAYPI